MFASAGRRAVRPCRGRDSFGQRDTEKEKGPHAGAAAWVSGGGIEGFVCGEMGCQEPH